MLDNPQFFITIMTLPFILIIGLIALVFYRSMRKANASKRWPVTDGQIVSSKVTHHRSSSSNGASSTIYEPAVLYEYNVNGQKFVASRINFGAVGGTSAQGWAEGIVAKYPSGSAVQVFYDPAKPNDATLDHSGKATGSIILMLVMMAVEVPLVALLVAAWTGQVH